MVFFRTQLTKLGAMKAILISLLGILLAGVPTCKVKDVKSDSEPITHELWTQELEKFVTDDGWVDYDAWKADTAGLVEYLDLLSTHHPNEKNWSRDQRFAYWLNAYNAFTVKLMVDHWPVASIKEIKGGIGFVNSIWDQKFITIEGNEYDLNDIEHGIIRPKFEDQRIHMAVNCASVSCPALLNEAFTAERLDAQLDQQSRIAFKSFRNDLSDPTNPKISSIFKWYGGDFSWNNSSLEAFVEKYGEVDLPEEVNFTYLDYNWAANSVGNKR